MARIEARTSKTHPLQIDEVLCLPGVLGLTFCPGKKGPSVFGAAWDRDLEIDVEAIRSWAASTVVTLVEARELDMLQVSGLGQAIAEAGIKWMHVPIEDLGVPDEAFERRWLAIGHLVREDLRNGRRVVIHCRGGRGRAGLVAARILVECGLEADEAITRVRHARPGSIETLAQENHVRDCRSIAQDPAVVDRILGCLFGGAVGDAFGYAVEFDRLVEIKRRYGPDGLTDPVLKGGKFVVSDDTQMTLFTAQAVAEGGDVVAFSEAYRDWHRTQTERGPFSNAQGLLRWPELWAHRAPGNTCLSALASGRIGTLQNRINDSKGCGGVMRVAPIGLNKEWNEETAFNLAVQAAAVTHGHPSGFFSAGALAVMVRILLEGGTTTAAFVRATEALSCQTEADETLDAMRQAFQFAGLSDSHKRDVAEGRLGEGWVGEEALAIALYSVLTTSDFKGVMRIAANHDGDSDSTASIAGQLFGARQGLSQIPWPWVSNLDVFDALCEAAEPLVRRAV
ncbi:ADP-ribosylglycohydrolase family protein [Brevundimonas bullata]